MHLYHRKLQALWEEEARRIAYQEYVYGKPMPLDYTIDVEPFGKLLINTGLMPADEPVTVQRKTETP